MEVVSTYHEVCSDFLALARFDGPILARHDVVYLILEHELDTTFLDPFRDGLPPFLGIRVVQEDTLVVDYGYFLLLDIVIW